MRNELSLPVRRAAEWLVCALVFTLPIEKGIMFAGVASIAHVIGALAFAAGAAAALAARKLRTPNAALLLAAAYIAWAGVTWFWSNSPSATAVRFATMAKLLAMTWLIWEICRTQMMQFRLVQAFVAGTAASSVWTILRLATNHQTNYRRYATAGFDPNDLGITLAIGLTLALYLSLHSRGFMLWVVRLAAALTVFAIVLTASRTALVAGLMNFVFLALTWRRSSASQRISTAVLLLLLVVGPIRLAPATTRARLATLPHEATEGTLHDRTRIWKAGLQLFRSRPVQGIGLGAYPDAAYPILRIHYNAHSTYLSVLVETGIIGFLLWGAFMATLLWFVWLLAESERSLWLSVLVVWGTGVLTVAWEHRKPTWMIFALIMTAWARSFRTEESKS